VLDIGIWGYGDVGTYLFVILLVLIIEIRFERQLGAAVYAFEATGMKECEILERPHTIHLIDGLAAAQASRLVEIWPIHNVAYVVSMYSSCLVFLFFLWQLPTGFRWTCTLYLLSLSLFFSRLSPVVFQFHLAWNLRVYSASFSSLQSILLLATETSSVHHPLIRSSSSSVRCWQKLSNENDRKRLLAEWEIEISYFGWHSIFFRPRPNQAQKKFSLCAGVFVIQAKTFIYFGCERIINEF